MKRFICALAVLIITITSAILLTCKINKTADGIIEYIELNGSNQITDCWDDNRLIFSVFLSQEKADSIHRLFNKAAEGKSDALSEIICEMTEIKEASRLTFENIL